MKVCELSDGCAVAQALVVRAGKLSRLPDGGDCLELLLGDRTGTVAALARHDAEASAEFCVPGRILFVSGRFDGGRLLVDAARPAIGGEYDPTELLNGPQRDPQSMEADVRALIDTVQDGHLRRLLDRVFGEGSDAWEIYRQVPAAKHYHQAYTHGLLEHCLTVAQSVSAISAIYPGIDRDVAVTGALLHDIGKLEVYETDGELITMSDAGRLEGEIPLGYYRIRREIDALDGFPPELARAITHIILSHHGTLRHGSPVVPCTREATLVHMMDNLGSRLGSFDRVERELPAGERWSAFDKGIGGGAFFPARDEARRAA